MAIKLANNAVGIIASSITDIATSLSLQPGQGNAFPALSAGDWCPGTIINSAGQIEIVRVTARTSDTLVIERAQEGTVARAFNPGDRFEHRLTAGALNSIIASLDSLSASYDKIRPRVGDIKPWHGAVDQIAVAHGAGWQLADGTNGTTDLRDRFIVGAGATYDVGDIGGANNVTLTTAQMPSHSHANTLTDTGHVHANTLTDPKHSHAFASGLAWTNGGPQTWGGGSAGNIGVQNMVAAATGITINNAGANAGITLTNASQGSGGAHENRPPYYAVAFIEYVG